MVTYPLTMPAVGLAKISFRYAGVGGMTTSPYTGEQETTIYPGQWWEADVSFVDLSMQAAGAVEAFIGLLNGPAGTFLLGDPMRPVPFGSAAGSPGTPLVNGAQLAQAQVLNVKGGPLSVSQWLKAGDLIELGSGSDIHLHKVLLDAATDGSGNTSLQLWPFLRENVSDGATVTITACKGIFRIPTLKPQIDRTPGPKTMHSFTAVEAI